MQEQCHHRACPRGDVTTVTRNLLCSHAVSITPVAWHGHLARENRAQWLVFVAFGSWARCPCHVMGPQRNRLPVEFRGSRMRQRDNAVGTEDPRSWVRSLLPGPTNQEEAACPTIPLSASPRMRGGGSRLLVQGFGALSPRGPHFSRRENAPVSEPQIPHRPVENRQDSIIGDVQEVPDAAPMGMTLPTRPYELTCP